MKNKNIRLIKLLLDKLSTQAEQVAGKSNNIDNIPEIGKIIIKDGTKGKELKFIQLNAG